MSKISDALNKLKEANSKLMHSYTKFAEYIDNKDWINAATISGEIVKYEAKFTKDRTNFYEICKQETNKKDKNEK